MDGDHDVALVFGGEKSGGSFDEAESGKSDEGEGEEAHFPAVLDHPFDHACIPAFDGIVEGIEATEENVFGFFGIGLAEPKGALGGFERDGIDAAEDGGDGDDEGELAIHLADDSGEEGGGKEDRNEDERDARDGGEEFVHGSDGGIFGGLAVFDVFGGSFDDHDGVIDDDADGEDDAEKGEGIDGETHGGDSREGADDGHGDGGRGDESGAPILEENDDHEEDEGPGFEEGFVDFVDGFGDELGVIEGDIVLEIFRESEGEFFEFSADAFGGIEGIGTGELIDGEAASGLAVIFGELAIGDRTEFDASDVFESGDLSAVFGIGFDDDVFELLDFIEFAVGVDGELEGLGGIGGGASELAGADLDILVLESGNDIARGEGAFLKLRGV